ncbi:MAG: hypothetical protein JOZ19_13660 [Rubrobacter sp.]|nr:hypothetical protein [Rubrobacter sp.]
MQAQPSAPERGVPILSPKRWIGVVIVTLLVAIPAMILGPMIWPPVEMGMPPTPGQIPYLIFEKFFEALSLGLGVSFLIFGLPIVCQAAPNLRLRVWLMYLSIGWSLVSWWPHGNLHTSNGDDMQRLLYIEYGFHVTLIITGAIVAYCFLSLLRGRSGREEASSVR